MQFKVFCKKVMNLLLATEFYSIVFLLITVFFQIKPYSKYLVVSGIFPLLWGKGYWFVSIYLLMYLVSPILNIAIERMKKKTISIIILSLLLIWCILPSTIGVIKGLNSYGCSEFTWFALIYLIGAYFRKYSFPLFNKFKISLFGLFACFFIMFSAISMKMYLENSDSGLVQKLLRIFSRSDLYSIMPLLISLFLFFVFKERKIKHNKVILLVAKSTFGIYLIHDNQMFFNFLWKKIINVEYLYSFDSFWIVSIFVVLTLFALCSFIEILRQSFLEKHYTNSKLYNNMIIRIEKILR